VSKKKARWRKLDNAAKLYSAASNKKDTRVFRFYCELKEEVNPDVLQEALNQTIETFPTFLMVLRKGLFWHYLEPCNLRPIVKEEYKEPCSRLYIKDKKTLLFEVTYYKKRINFEVFHVLTDGTGATEFLKELVKNYLYLIHKVNGLEAVSLLPEDMTVQDQEVDSFLKYYSKDQKRPKKRKLHAFQIRKRKKDGNHLHVHESVVSVQAVLKRSRELGVSMTVFLTALFMMAINEEMSKMQKKKPVVLMVPVNLRKFFPSLSMLNFFNWIEPGLKLKNFKLFATDMDSTFLNLETLDEMASFVGKGEEVAHITELAMQGKIKNYAESLTARVKLMAGADASIVDRLIDRHIKPNPGAEKLVAAFKAAGIPMLLVSGGFSCVTEVVKERYGFTHVISNELEIVDGKLTGRVTGPFGTPIIDGRGKISYVSAYALQHGIELSELITMGDGSNDIPMLEAAGLSIAWHAKPKVRPHAKQAFDFAPLSGVLALFD